MPPKHTFKKFLLLLLLANLCLSWANVASAKQLQSYDYAKDAHVSDQIKEFLCAPSDVSKDKGETNIWFGTDTAAQNNSAQNDLYLCINRIYKFAIALAAVAGIAMIVVAGYLYMASDGNQESVDKAKSIFVSSITAMIILFAGYLILRTLNPDLIAFKNIQPPSVRVAPSNWNDWQADLAGVGNNLSQIGVPAGQNGTCQEQSVNLCQARPSGCGSNACGAYSAAIKDAANKFSIPGVNTESLIRAIMYNESSCGARLTSSSNPPSCGIMQLQPATANMLKSACGVTDNITCDWLNNPSNFAKSICIGTYYLKQLAGTCGNNIVNIAAGYNGGSTACQPSVTCSGQQSCSGGSTRRWECLYNGPAGSRTECNTGYTETRLYAPKVLDCYNKQ